MDEQYALQSRLKNCLQTILEFEADITALHTGSTLLDDFVHLRDVLERLPQLLPEEDDVQRIERATAVLLEELARPLRTLHEGRAPRAQIQ